MQDQVLPPRMMNFPPSPSPPSPSSSLAELAVPGRRRGYLWADARSQRGLIIVCVAAAGSMPTAYRIPQPAICSRWPSKLHVFEMLLFAHSTVHPHEYIKKKKTRQKKKKKK